MTKTIPGNLNYVVPKDGAYQRPYDGFLGEDQGGVDTGSSTIDAVDFTVRADVSYDSTAHEANIRLTPAFRFGSAALHVVGGSFMNAVQENLLKARIRRFY